MTPLPRPARRRPPTPDPLPPHPRRVPGPPPSPGPRPPDPLPAEAGSRTEPIPVVAAAVAGGPAKPALDEVAVELDTPAASVSASAIPPDLDRRAKEPTRRVQRWRWLGTWLAGVSAAPQVPAQTMLRPLFAESDTLEELLASVRAQSDVHSVHARRVRMIAIGVAVIVVILAVVLLV